MGHISALPRLQGAFYFTPFGSRPFLAKAASIAANPTIQLPTSAFLAPRLGTPPLAKLFGILPLQIFAGSALALAGTNALNLKAATASGRVLETLALIDKKLKTTVYNATTKIDLDKGNFQFDCSGMVNWILQQAAPTAFSELRASRPRVIEYVKAFQKISPNQPSAGWRRVAKIADAEPGDVIAWPTPDWYPSNATGHMGILLEKPEAVDGGYLLRLADSTSYPHGDDSREGGTGFGYGTVLITVDPTTGEGTGQGWTGRHSYNTVIETPILVGRPLK